MGRTLGRGWGRGLGRGLGGRSRRVRRPSVHGACGGTPGPSVGARVVARARRATDEGMATAEYAIATLAAVAFAGVLLVVLKGGQVKALLTGLIAQALGG
ncbi:MAG: DUF4244 domain-containing protein [Cellulomonas iranensis]|nr:DUF4244 domain-containing protein [Cellulomonas iranensis]